MYFFFVFSSFLDDRKFDVKLQVRTHNIHKSFTSLIKSHNLNDNYPFLEYSHTILSLRLHNYNKEEEKSFKT